MTTRYDLQEERYLDAEFAWRFERALECRDAANHRAVAKAAWEDHVENCPLGDECEAVT